MTTPPVAICHHILLHCCMISIRVIEVISTWRRSAKTSDRRHVVGIENQPFNNFLERIFTKSVTMAHLLSTTSPTPKPLLFSSSLPCSNSSDHWPNTSTFVGPSRLVVTSSAEATTSSHNLVDGQQHQTNCLLPNCSPVFDVSAPSTIR